MNTGNLPPGTTDPAAPAPPEPAAPEPSRLEQALAVEKRQRAAREPEFEADPNATTVVEPVVDPEATPAESSGDAIPTLDELPALIEQRKQERLATEQAEAERRELETLRAQHRQQQTPAVTVDDLPKYFESLEPGQKRDLLKSLVQSVNATPAEKAIAPRVEAAERKAQLALDQQQKELEERARVADSAREDAFVELTGDTERWPSAALLQPEERLQLGYEIVAEYKRAGVKGVTDEHIANELEKKAKPRIDRILAARRGPEVGTPAVPEARPAAPDSPARPDAPATLSNQHAATASLRAPQSYEERRAAAMKLERRHRAAREG